MSNKNRNKGKDKDKSRTSGDEGGSAPAPAATAAPRAPRPPLPPLSQRLRDRADKVYDMVAEISKVLADRGAPQEYVDVAAAFVSQVEGWRAMFMPLQLSGWEPFKAGDKVEISEGDKIQILPEHASRYSFIEGLAEGETKLVAGAVDQINKRAVQVMLKSEDGKFYGYAPRQFLTKRQG